MITTIICCISRQALAKVVSGKEPVAPVLGFALRGLRQRKLRQGAQVASGLPLHTGWRSTEIIKINALGVILSSAQTPAAGRGDRVCLTGNLASVLFWL